jgi:hypothetical protein
VVTVDSDGDVIVTFGIQDIKFNPECLNPSKGSPDDFKEEAEPQKREDSNVSASQAEDPSVSQRETTEPSQERSISPSPQEDLPSERTPPHERRSPVPERATTPPPQKPISSDEQSDRETEDLSGGHIRLLYMIIACMSIL